MANPLIRLIIGQETPLEQFVANRVKTTDTPVIVMDLADSDEIAAALSEKEDETGCQFRVTLQGADETWPITRLPAVNARIESLLMYHCGSRDDVLAEELLIHRFDRIIAENDVRDIIRFLNMIKQKMADYETAVTLTVNTGSIDEDRIKTLESNFDEVQRL